MTQRVRVGMKPGVGHEGPEGVDQSLGGRAPLQQPQFWQGNVPKGGPEGPKSGNGVPEVDTNVQESGREVLGFGYKVQRSDAKSEGCGLNPKGVRKQPKARNEGFWDSTRMD